MSETISFSTQQLASGLRSGILAEPITTAQVGGPDTVTQRVVAAIVGDGDSLLESGETGFILANGSNLEGGITRTTLNGANDPVTVTAHGWARIRAVEPLYLNDYLTFTTEQGFKVSGANARPGNSITWTLNDKDGAAQKLDAAEFVVNTGGVAGPVSVAMDFDGDIIASGIYSETDAPAEAALTLQAQDGDVIAIDFLANTFTLNGVPVTGTEIDQFFAAYTASAGNTLTIGSADTATFAVKDLTLERSDKTAAPNKAPFIAVSQVVSDLLDGADLVDRVKVADIQILDDGIGTNILSLSGEDASLFEIIGTGLYLKAGTDIDMATNPTLRVFVTVEDQSLPDAPVSAEVVVQVRDAVTVESMISFGSVQLTSQPGNVIDPISTDNLGTGTDYRKQALIAIEGDGDRAFEAGETGYILAAVKDDLVHTRLTTLNTDTDPVTITGHGWYRSSAVSQLNLNAAMVYDPATGFRIESSSSRPGDSLTWRLNDKDGVAQKLAAVSFVVHSSGTVSAAFDIDGDTILSGSYGNGRLATPDALLTIDLNDGDIVRIDFATSSFTVNGQALPAGAASQFFSEFAASDQAAITIGGIGIGGFSVGDLTLHRGGGGTPPPTNLPPTVSLANIVASVAETRDMSVALKVADIVVGDDGMGTNVLGLTGANAALFEIVGTELFLKAGTVLDFETAQSLQVTVTVDDTTLGAAGSVEATVPFVLSVTDANEGPIVTLANVIASVSEAQDTSVPLKVADIVVTDDGVGSNILSLSGTDAGLFEIVGTELFLKAGVALDFETLPSLSVNVDVDDTTIGTAGSVESSTLLMLPVADANEAPVVTLANVVTGVAETQDLSVRLKVADIVVTDDALGTNLLTLSGADAALFEIVGTELFLRAGTVLDFETVQSLSVSVDLDDTTLGLAGSIESTAGLTLAVTDANEPPAVTLANVVASVSEGQDLSAPFKVADIVVTDDGVGTNTLVLSGADAALFEIVGTELFLKAGVILDFETLPSLSISVDVDDTTIGASGSVESSAPLTLPVTDSNDAPVVTLANVVASVSEDQNLTAALKVADIVVTDDALGTNALTLSGADAALFEIVGTELFLKAGTALDFETLPSLSVSVDVDDATLGTGVDGSTPFTLAVTDVKETWGAIEVDGAVGEWPAFSLLASDPSGAEVRGTYQDGAFIVALSTNGVPIGPNTTFWFDTDLNSATGYQVFGSTAGAEFNVNIDADGRPVLYTGADGETEITPLIHKFSADGTVLEFALPSNLVGGATAAKLFVDLNNSVFIPGDYSLGGLPIGDNLSATVTLANQITSIPEDQNLTTALKVADIVVSDDTIGTNTLSLSGANAALFEIVGTELFLKAGTALDFETLTSLSVSVDLDDTTIGAPGSVESSAPLTLAVTDVKETWGIIELDGAVGEWPGYTLLASDGGYEVRGTYQDGAFVMALSTGGAAIGPNTTFWLNTDLDPATGYQVFGSTVGAEYNINIGPDGRPALYSGAVGETLVSPLIFSFNADRSVLEFALPSDLVGGSAAAKLYLDVNDTVFIPGNYFGSTGLAIGNNLAPTVTLTQTLFQIAENASVLGRTKVADIVVTDDGIGTNELKLSGADAGLFEILGTELYIKAGAVLDFETNATLDINVDVDDTSVGTAGSIEATAPFAVTVTDVAEQFGAVTLDGSTAEWAANTQLYTRSTGGVDYTVNGTYGAGAFLIALEAETLEIGADTTIWLNTDRNAATGFQVFGNGVGAEYNIEFEADGTLALYSGDAGQTFVSNLNYFFDADHGTVEIALPSTLVGGSTNLEMYIDVNNTTFLPEAYASGGFVVREATPVQPTDPTVRIAIVYSESSANAYFDKTAYGQLVMSAQNQAMQAGIPFDLISEADLTDIAKIKDYDAIVFPEFSHVEASLVQGITDTLTEASQTYGIGLIASGNFMTNTDTGAIIGSDAYARMKSLLGVTLGASGSTAGLTMNAEDVTHPISDGYTANELVGTYTNSGFQSFIDFNGTGQVLFTQTTTTQGEVAAVIATTTGGRNVHFASDAISGNNNILQEAIQWSALGDLPEVSLEMTRGTSLFFSRNDMDQSQETYDVVDPPRIYDAMIPIVQSWYEEYNFVGSYYINVGANPPDQETNWAVSSPYYQQLLAMENEIGTHSYTHPDNTNFLLPDVMTQAELDAAKAGSPALASALGNMSLSEVNAAMAAALAASDPDTVSSVDLTSSSFTDAQAALLQHSFTFQWEYSRQIIEQQLGLTNLGGAVPGAPEQLYSTFNILPFVSYLTGGYAGVGAGYPGAFGFLDPNHTDQVYFAPNVSFDFSLIGFRNLSPAQAEAVWAQEYANITSHGGAPIIHFPWHDYGPTNWDLGDGPNAPQYTEEMFTNFIARAYADGTEFVTGADLAERILAFSQAQLQIQQSGSNLVVTATGNDLGTFALDMEEGSTIANVDNWYAYDDGKVFLDRDGGVYTVAFGSQSDDVTHIVKLPMRADLISVLGNGSDLEFSFDGRGDVGVELKSLGDNSVVASGADSVSRSGDTLTMSFGTVGVHNGDIDYQSGTTVLGTADDDFILLSDQGRTVNAGLGNDVMTAGLGADVFVFGPAVGSDTVLAFDLSVDHIDLVGTTFGSTADVVSALTQADGGVELAFSATDKVFFADLVAGSLTESHFSLDNIA
ncbi:hypothetical protein EF888_18210 [Silicimonas algicola]|uniref:Cadherin domain-containing protein n=1 Tax=Silicimonas algicola TaxID=1826607 RepID=A0A316G5V5_9RHOB|nr:hypothetical protein [Silicimonas algicola]AZQ68890.1 hypothetical protein EF888_18210 [Silicimonas algicola]PWK56013.1 hypothetical protein C8D95_10578 [Silicimonas algicola]